VITGPALRRVSADPTHIEQLLMNLVVNSRDAMPRGGRLRIVTGNADLDAEFARTHDGAVVGSCVSLVVEDSGCGMTPDVLAHVFEPFFTTKPSGKGTGLGLATVYGIVKQAGGYITIDSTPGQGTRVSTYFPAVDGLPAQRGKSAPAAESLRGTETILVAEDQYGVRLLIRRVLERYGYRVLMPESIADVLAAAARHDEPIHMLLSDVIMPEMSGPDLAQRIVRIRPDIRVLYVSGYPSRHDFGVMSRKTAFLAKPFTPQTLAAKVRECLDQPDLKGA
jgi:two-component system, cell cycle sensor histidine kinase and response regulator CckA